MYSMNEALYAKMAVSLLPCSAFAFGVDILSDREYVQEGVRNHNVSDGAYSFRLALVMLAFDSVLYAFLAWRADNFSPSPKPHPAEKESLELTYVETPKNRAPSIDIRQLCKSFPGSKTNALSNLSVSAYDNEITCVLGQNGSGKSIIFSILTGLIRPTSGECTVFGLPLESIGQIRKHLAVCLQPNVMFGNLTVLEHLRFFESIKGNDRSTGELIQYAEDIGLGDKAFCLSSTLSIGMKRKLSVGIAFTGDPTFVVLDEPTAGMDPYARRATWNLIAKLKVGRAILMTTHFMDEAEFLGDRIIILKGGRMQCSGSPMFLELRIGWGYNLRMILQLKATTTKFSRQLPNACR